MASTQGVAPGLEIGAAPLALANGWSDLGEKPDFESDDRGQKTRHGRDLRPRHTFPAVAETERSAKTVPRG
jgi:hypothetical protein